VIDSSFSLPRHRTRIIDRVFLAVIAGRDNRARAAAASHRGQAAAGHRWPRDALAASDGPAQGLAAIMDRTRAEAIESIEGQRKSTLPPSYFVNSQGRGPGPNGPFENF